MARPVRAMTTQKRSGLSNKGLILRLFSRCVTLIAADWDMMFELETDWKKRNGTI